MKPSTEKEDPQKNSSSVKNESEKKTNAAGNWPK